MPRVSRDKGLYRRKNRWWFKWYLPGHGSQQIGLVPDGDSRATTNLHVARLLAAEVRRSGKIAAEIRRLRTAGPRPAKGDAAELAPSIERLLGQFADANRDDRATADQVRRNVSKLRAFLAAYRILEVRSITTAAIAGHLDRLKAEGLSASTRSKARAAISSFCRFLVLHGRLEFNPARAVPAPRLELPPPRFLDQPGYEQALELAEDSAILPEVGTALWTGMRRGQLQRLDWSDIKWSLRMIVLTKTKTGRPRQIPMAKKLIDLLDRHAQATRGRRRPKAGPVFVDSQLRPRPDSWWDHALDPLRERIPAFRGLRGTSSAWHLLRHTFATRLVRTVPLRKLADFMGHASIATTMRYAHHAPGYDAAIEAV